MNFYFVLCFIGWSVCFVDNVVGTAETDDDAVDSFVSDFQVVETKSGSVRGKRLFTLLQDKPYYAFKGIRYGRPPINDLRFRAPKEALRWPNIYDAFEFGNECLQVQLFTNSILGQEDCLFLNIYVPESAFLNVSDATKLPVMFYIHGGGYIFGSGNVYGADFLLDHDVIVITFNYRLGPFGFVSLDKPDYSGNMGLKDQRLALQWANNNVEHFGGDKNQITIFGHSAGSASAHFHVLSPSSRHLFQRAIMSSGTALNPWAYTDRNHLTYLSNLAANINYPIENNRDLITLLRQIDGKLLLELTKQKLYVPGLGRKVCGLIWAPIVEYPHAVDPIITSAPFERMNDAKFSSDIDTMFGYTDMEMYFFLSDEFSRPDKLNAFDQQFEIQLPMKNAKLKFNSKQYKEIAMEMRNYYFGNKRISNETFYELSKLMSDIWFNYGIDVSARIQANKSTGQTFFYTFSVVSDLNLFRKLSAVGSYGLNGSTHCDDIFYLFRPNGVPIFPDDKYKKLPKDSIALKTIEIMTKIWTDFAKYGNPLPSDDDEPIWFNEYNENRLNYIDISNDGIVIEVNPDNSHFKFWNRIMNEYNHLWKPKLFTLNSLAVKIPLALLISLLLLIFCCKSISAYVQRRKHRKANV